MGSPLNSLRWLLNALTRDGVLLKAGSVVIPGSPVELVTIDADTKLEIQIESVGNLAVRFLHKQKMAIPRCMWPLDINSLKP